jgi:hypothetical protein
MKCREFHLSDFDNFVERDIHSDSVSFHRENIIGIQQLNTAVTVSLVNDEESVLAIFGLVMPWDNFGDCFALLSEDAVKRPIELHKSVLSIIEHFEKVLELHRMQITVKEGYNIGMKWATALGFKQEGLMHKFMPDGGNHYLYARVSK